MSSTLQIACVQLDIKLGEIEINAEKVKQMTSHLKPSQVDLLVLPEMCLTGYEFTSPTEILPFLEDPMTGPTAKLCQILAKALQCHVIAGYPEIAADKDAKNGKIGFNSAMLVAPGGEVIGNARATYLSGPADSKWAIEDVNTKDFNAEHCITNKANLTVIPMGWHDGEFAGSTSPPICQAVMKGEMARPIIIACNRIGTERATTYCGSSCIMSVDDTDEYGFRVVKGLDQTEEAILLTNVDVEA